MNWGLNKRVWFLLGLLPILLVFLHFVTGEIPISGSVFWESILQFDPSKTEHQIIKEFRIPRIIMCLVAGAGLSISGLFMQTLFQNPLAGPYVLGVNSGSSLFVALSIMTGWTFLQHDLGLIFSALLGAGIFALVIMTLSSYLNNNLSLLLVGLMIGSFASAIVSILQSLSEANALKLFTLWSMGSLQQVEFKQLGVILIVFIVGLILSYLYVKPLNALILGEADAAKLGIKVKRSRWGILLTTVILTGLITAFCGPIAFIGLAVPNLVRILFRTQNHRVLLPASILIGMSFLLACDIVVQIVSSITPIPINAITSIIGAPMVIYFIIKRLA